MALSSIPGGMAESVDAVDLKSAGRKVVGVQVSLPPLKFTSYSVFNLSFLSVCARTGAQILSDRQEDLVSDRRDSNCFELQ